MCGHDGSISSVMASRRRGAVAVQLCRLQLESDCCSVYRCGPGVRVRRLRLCTHIFSTPLQSVIAVGARAVPPFFPVTLASLRFDVAPCCWPLMFRFSLNVLPGLPRTEAAIRLLQPSSSRRVGGVLEALHGLSTGVSEGAGGGGACSWTD